MNRLITVLIAMLLASCSPSSEPTTLIRNVTIVDGTGAPAFAGAVRLEGDRIVAVGELAEIRTDEVVDGQGMLLAPGFIDTHSHHDGGLEHHRDMLAAISQGITTIVRGADGFGEWRESDNSFALENFIADFEAMPAALNIASFSAHGSIRSAVLGSDSRRLSTAGEIAAMSELVADDMAHGALGLATGLEYEPGIFSNTEEVIELSRVAAAAGGRYMSHLRDEDDQFSDAIEEIIRIGREASIPVHVSHIKLADKYFWGTTDSVLDRLNEARANGVEISADIYPYLYWQSDLAILFPDRDYTDRDAAVYTFERTTEPDTVIIAYFAANPAYEGKTIAEIAGLREQDPVTTLLELAQESDAYLQETGNDGDRIIAKSMAHADVLELMKWDFTNICSDGRHDSHPRGHGAFPTLFQPLRNGGLRYFHRAGHRQDDRSVCR